MQSAGGDPPSSHPPSTPSTPASPFNFHAPPPSPPRKRAKRRRRMPDYDKLLDILQRLKDMRWNVRDFLSTLVNNSGRHKVRRAQTLFLDFAYMEFPTDENFSRRIGPLRKSTFMDKHCWRWIMDALGQEIKALAAHPAFASFQPTSQTTDFGSLESITQTAAVIKNLAPRWLELIETVCVDGQRGTPIDIASLTSTGPHVIMLALLCHKFRPNKANNIQTVLGLYLYQGGARRRVIDTFSQYGLTKSYKTLKRRMNSLVSAAEEKARVVSQSFEEVDTYDNFDFPERNRGERTRDSRVMRSITTSLVVEGREFDDGPLKRDM